MMNNRAYKLQVFVAHESTVNCLQIGRKSSRVLVTGGEDHKVNLWAIGKPNAIASLSGHSSGIDSVTFDSSEVLVAAGAASGTVKIWDLEEAKIVRTLTGHRSNCNSVDFHPFGELFASGSLDTNLKIWDIRKKGCIHTYKGHACGINALRFTPDGRWVVSGGEDNTVKLWDLTAGKLMHDFKYHEGQVQCIDFHPHEFLMATGSADKTVKFWDLETFELAGTVGPESSGVRCLTFNPDGKTLLCGLNESLKVFSWEPMLCHDSVEVGWSKLSDLNVHEGKLLGCSYNQSCVGVWVVDILRLEPYSISMDSNSSSETKSAAKSVSSRNLSVLTENTMKPGIGRFSTSQNLDSVGKETKHVGSATTTTNPVRVNKDTKVVESTSGDSHAHHKSCLSTSPKNTATSTAISSTVSQRRSFTRKQIVNNMTNHSSPDIIPVILPRIDPRLDSALELGKERSCPPTLESKPPELSGALNKSILPLVRNLGINHPVSELDPKEDGSVASMLQNRSALEPKAGYRHQSYDFGVHSTNMDRSSREVLRTGSKHSSFSSCERKEKSQNYEGSNTAIADEPLSANTKCKQVGLPSYEIGTCSVSDEDVVADLLEKHGSFMSALQARLAKLQIVRKYWERNDIKAAILVMEKMVDHGVLADVTSLLKERANILTLDICTVLLPILARLLESDIDRHLGISLEMLVKLVRAFGSVIYSATSSSPPSIGIDIEAEKRVGRCNLCFVELEKVKCCLPSLIRKGGLVAKSAQELSLTMTAARATQ